MVKRWFILNFTYLGNSISIMKATLKVLFSTLLIVVLSCWVAQAQVLTAKKQVYQSSQLMPTADLLKVLNNPKAKKPLVYNIGFVGNIKGAKKIGAASKQEGLQSLLNEVRSLPRSTAIVVYCGCCPFEHCPNVRPAYTMLQQLGFKQTKILDLPTSIKADWMDKGYPMEN
jgi:thiosulfate/3-mercaptopyruvate sulfurtransferase